MFIRGKRYNRRQDLHARFAGQQQGGISTPKMYPIILLFTGEQGEQYGYRDGLLADGTYLYTGEGQVGDMEWVRGNRAVRDHMQNGKILHLFTEVKKGTVEYLGECVYTGHHRRTAPDRNGDSREAIVFELALEIGDDSGVVPQSLGGSVRGKRSTSRQRSLSELRVAALESSSETASSAERKARIRGRSEAIKDYVLLRASGVCEGCGAPAPFIRKKDGDPYLEPHHILRLADGGPDHPRWVIALCPNCHRRVHSGVDGDQYNSDLDVKVAEIEFESVEG